MWINAIFRRTAHLHYSLYFYLLLLITVRSFDLKSSSNRISSLSKFRSCCLTLHQTRIDKSPSPPDQLTSKVATIKSGQNVMKSGSGSEINQLIIVSLEDRNKTQKERLKLLKDIVTQKKGLLNHVHAATMLQRCARGRMDITEAIPLTSLAEILSKSSHRKLKSVEAAHAIYGLRLLDSETRDVMPFLSLLTTLVSNCDEPFKGQEIGNALYGLQKFPSHSPEVRKLLSVLEIKFKSPTIQLSPQEISNALYGLRKMNSDCPDVLNILTVLTQKTIDCKEPFNSVCIGNCLNGLQGMSSDNAVVIEMLRALVIKVAKSPDAITSQCIGSALMGVRRMDTSTTVVKTLLAILALKINESKLVLDPISFSMALNGLRSMDESSVEMRALLSTLGDKIKNMDEKVLSPNVISNAMSGLRKMSGEHPESRQVLTAILSKMGSHVVQAKANGPAPESTNTRQQPSIGQFTSLDIGRALYGLQSMSAESCPNVLPALNRMALSVRTSRGPLYARDAGLALFGLKSHIEEGVEVKEILSAITSRLSMSEDTMNAKSASMAMMGLQGLTSESKEVCDLLMLLGSRIGTLDSQACGNILYSMKKMTSNKSEVRAFLAALAPKIEACDEAMSSQELANAFYGLQGMDSTHYETRNLLRVLTQKLLESDVAFTGQGIGNALSGFQSMSLADGPQVEVALGVLADKLESCTDIMTPLDMSNALYGLQGISSDSIDVRTLLNVLIAKMKESEGIYSGRDIGYSLIGLTGMQPIMHKEVHEILEELNVKVSRSEFKGQPNLLFMQFGKGVRAKRGNSAQTLKDAKDLVDKKN